MPDVEGAGVEELLHGVAELFAGGVVDVGFEEDDVVLPVGEGLSFDRLRMSGWCRGWLVAGMGLPRFARNDRSVGLCVGG